MFARYALALGGGAHRDALKQRARATGLKLTVDRPGLLLAAPEGTPFLAGQRCILVGELFSRAHERLAVLPDAFNRPRCDLRDALASHWGNFALFHADDQCFSVYREPSGNVSAYRCGPPGAATFVSDAGIAAGLGLLDGASPDLQFVIHWLQFPFLRTRRTGVGGVTELLPGQLATSDASVGWTERTAWHPASVLDRAPAKTDPAAAAEELRELAARVLPAQVSARPVLRLSGGLDSSVIAACLARGGVDFAAVNFSTRSRDGDERDYARAVASMHGFDLTEIAEPEPAGLEIPRSPAFAPTTNPLLLPFDQAIRDGVGDSRLLVDGGGGDNLFCSLTSAAPVLDALLALRLRTAARAAADIAERANCTLWDVAGAAAHRSVRPRRRWKEDRTFLREEWLLPSPDEHPWLRGLHAAPGKREHVEAIVHIHHFLDRGQGETRLLHPLLCQPLLELCLTIPTWLWVRGGRDRAVARDAFAALLPPEVVRRRSKGSLQSMFHRSFGRLGSQMADLLRSGALASRGIVDVAAIERSFATHEWERDEAQLRLSEMVAMELWMRSWSPAARASSAS